MGCRRGRWRDRTCCGCATPPPDSAAPDGEDPAVEAAEAWKAVGLVNDWVRHAETKAATTLAASGVIGGVLYNLVKAQTDIGLTLTIAAPLSAALAVAAAVCAVVALWPRLRSREAPTNALYFDHIARRHPKSAAGYIRELKEMIADPDVLLDHLGQQVWANARVARRKYRWAGWALVALMGAALALAVVALKLALLSIGVLDG
jgi:hypothetical protein